LTAGKDDPTLEVNKFLLTWKQVQARANQPWNPAGIPQSVEPLEVWPAGSPLVRVDFIEGASS
jgi:hypothetical protein